MGKLTTDIAVAFHHPSSTNEFDKEILSGRCGMHRKHVLQHLDRDQGAVGCYTERALNHDAACLGRREDYVRAGGIRVSLA